MNLCFLRSDVDQQPCIDSQGEERHLLLSPQHCTLCEEYRDCAACTQVLHPHQHVWKTAMSVLIQSSMQSVYQLSCSVRLQWSFSHVWMFVGPLLWVADQLQQEGRLSVQSPGRLEGSIREPGGCPKVCNQWVWSDKLVYELFGVCNIWWSWRTQKDINF